VLYGLGYCEFLMIWRWWCGRAVQIGFLWVPDDLKVLVWMCCTDWVLASSWFGAPAGWILVRLWILGEKFILDLVEWLVLRVQMIWFWFKLSKMIFWNNRSNCTGAKFNRLGAGNKCCSVQPDLYSLVLLNPEVDLSAIWPAGVSFLLGPLNILMSSISGYTLQLPALC